MPYGRAISGLTLPRNATPTMDGQTRENKPETRGSRETRDQRPDRDKTTETMRLETLEISNLRKTLMFIYRICGFNIP